MPDLARAEGLFGYAELVSQLGGDPLPLLAGVGLTPEVFSEPDRMLLARDVALLLERSAQSLPCPDFGMRLASQHDISALGPLALVIKNCPTVGEALALTARFFSTQTSAARISIERKPGAGAVRLLVDFSIDGVKTYPQIIEFIAAAICRIMDQLTQGVSRRILVQLPHAAIAGVSVYRDRFGCPVTFNAPGVILHIPPADFDLAIPNGDAMIQRIAQEFIARHYESSRATLAGQVRHLVGSLVSTPACTQVKVAHLLRMHPRTLHRRLTEEDTKFADIVSEVRAQQAERLLAQAHIPMGRVSEMLGYSEQSAFTLACRRWFGVSPSAMRRQLLGEPSQTRAPGD